MRKFNNRDLTLMGLAITINIIGAFIAVVTKIPLLLDHIGTLMICLAFGWKYAVVCAFCSSCINTMLFDPYALPFAPTGMLMVTMVGILLEKGIFKKLGRPLAMAIAVLPASILGAVIAGYIFGGVTSSGSSIIVRFLINRGLNPAFAVFIIQYFMEYLDRLMSFSLVSMIYERYRFDKI
jgi:energy-coupling factor transport system substrate-specific component